MKDKLRDGMKEVLSYVGLFFGGSILLGILISELFLAVLPGLFVEDRGMFDPWLLIDPKTYLVGFLAMCVIAVLWLVFDYDAGRRSRRMMNQKARRIEGALKIRILCQTKSVISCLNLISIRNLEMKRRTVCRFMPFIIIRKKISISIWLPRCTA